MNLALETQLPRLLLVAGLLALSACSGAGKAPDAPGAGTSSMNPELVETLDVSDVFSGHPVNFALLTHDEQQFAAFYDAERALTVASRTLGSSEWTLARLDTVLGWDSHNHVALAIDELGHLHVAGNMHGVPLIYFRTTRERDVTSFERVPNMVGTNEQNCTYPEFFVGPSGKLVFLYRDGASGSGNHIFNTYDAASSTWARLLDTPLTSGEGLCNAYPVGPVQGPAGDWHVVWVWRDTPDAATNHDLSYARSEDLRSFQRGDGGALRLPITLATSDIVDPVPIRTGMINNNTKVGFDAQDRPVVAYHKYDAAGNTQIYNARLEEGRWVVHQTTDWSYRWDFGGQGTLVFAVELDGVRSLADGTLVQDFHHAEYGGRGTLRLDPETLHAEETLPPLLPYPSELDRPESTTPGMVVRWARSAGGGPDPDVTYLLRWETLESNRDQPRATIPPPTGLRLYAFR